MRIIRIITPPASSRKGAGGNPRFSRPEIHSGDQSSGAHLHMSVADAQGQVTGGHVAYGCSVRTTAEVLLVLLPEWSFTRVLDPHTGFLELVVRHQR